MLEPVQQRRHDRKVVEIPGLLRLIDTRGGIFGVTLLDLSKSGLRVSCPKPIAAGVRVEVNCRNTKIYGTVKYARECEHEFHLGIEADASETARERITGEELDLMILFPDDVKRLQRPSTTR